MSSVTLRDVSLVYPDGTRGLSGIDLTIADGEFVALVGPSGSGKTTLLRTIAGFLRPSSGEVLLGERVVASPTRLVEPERRGLGMVFQQHAIWPHWNVGRNVAYPLARAGVRRAERATRVAEVLDLVGLAGMERRDPATLSGGQRQRVALARAIVGRPSVLLLDEALSALDEPLRDALRLQLQTLTRQVGLTVVHVTHDRAEALALADRVVVLDSGRIRQVATPPELVARPVDPLVARFLSDATVFEGSISAGVFRAVGHPCTISVDDGTTGDATIAVLPEDVSLRAPAPGEEPTATVTSSLFGRDTNDVVVDWAGTPVRCRVAGHRPLVGEQVVVEVGRALVYGASTPRVREPEVVEG